MAKSAGEPARRQFALETIALLQQAARKTIDGQFDARERSMLAEIMANLEGGSAGDLKVKMRELTDSLGHEEMRGLEIIPDVTDLLMAVDAWLDYRVTGKPKYIARIGICMVNWVDRAIDEEGGDCSLDDMLGAPAMREEYARQQRLLVAVDAGAIPRWRRVVEWFYSAG